LIFCHPKLALDSEDVLLDLICHHVRSGDELYFDLLELVQVEFLSKKIVRQYWELVCDHFDMLNLNHWTSLQWTILRESRTSAYRHRHRFPVNSEMNGIVSCLTSICGGNVHEKSEVILTASSVHDNGGTARWEMKHAVDHNINTLFCSNGNTADWICFDFKERVVDPTHYSVCSGWHALKSWRVEGSFDGKTWILLDEKIENCDVKTDKSSCTFPVSRFPAIRMIRLTQTGPNHSGYSCLMLRRFEVFGTML
jgi:hypothetical protein